MQKLNEVKNKFSQTPARRDFDEISENFDLALSPEVIGWLNKQNGNVQSPKRVFKPYELDEYELSLI